jgi:hypothetical protein
MGVVLATVAAWYFFLRSPASTAPKAASSTPPTTVAPPPALSAPVTVAAEPTSAAPPTTVAVAPTPALTPPPVAPTAAPTVAPTAAPTPTPRPLPTAPAKPTPVPPAPAASAGDARGLLQRGALPEAARAFAAAYAPTAQGRFSLQVLTACAPDTVQKAVEAVGVDQLFILPVNFKGRDCYRLCWGVYGDRPSAEAAISQVPGYFRQGGAPPRLQPLTDLLP